ncbi:MAG: PEP/pyruvate-binding domain-containing protein [Desulfovibrionaceae bacterium]
MKNTKTECPISSRKDALVLTASDISTIGEEAELLVGGKNYNTAYINGIEGIKAPQFRAISAIAFHKLLDNTTVNAALVRNIVDKEYSRTDWHDPEISGDQEFLQKFVRNLGKKIRLADKEMPSPRTKLRAFINNVVDGFATSPEGIDQLRKRSIIVQAGILSVILPKEVEEAVTFAYKSICEEVGEEVSVAVRSSAAGEDSRKKAFAGLQDTYLNMQGSEAVLLAYHWDCASAYNLRSMTYRREAISDAMLLSEIKGDETIAQLAKEEWAIENTSLSVCIMRMINPLISGTAFSADTATGCRGTMRKDLVSIDASYGLGEAIVGGMVTPDKFYVYQRDDGQDVILRYMGTKEYKIVYNADSGTKKTTVPKEEAYAWSLSEKEIQKIAEGVRYVSRAYHDIIVDTEFCFDEKGELWFVQARPETRWNEELEMHPTTIFMRRKEVDPVTLANTDILLKGNGASRGAGNGTVKFLRSALELNKITKGDILVAERTDPDMVPGMRVASAILANVGGDTSHAAITSRELGIPAIIGVQRLEALRALDGQEITVDGTHGAVYKGLLPLIDAGNEIDTLSVPETQTDVGLVLADVGQSLFLSRLREIPNFEVGLLRAEFMLGNIGVHPLALEAYDNGTLSHYIREEISLLEQRLTKLLQEQMSDGFLTIQMNIRQYVAALTGLDKKLTKTTTSETRGSDEIHKKQQEIRVLEHKIDHHSEIASMNIDILQTSPLLEDHIQAVFEENLSKEDLKDLIIEAQSSPIVINQLNKIHTLRSSLAASSGIQKKIDEFLSMEEKIGHIIFSKGASSGKDYYIQSLSQGLALFAMAFHGCPIVYRTTDFKTNEYENLLGGMIFEKHEANPMLGYRGVSRSIHPWEAEAFKKARKLYGGLNLQLMLPFVRTLEEALTIKEYLANVHNIRSGEDSLSIILMSELPSNAILAKRFIEEFDGFSIGSNDMTQMILATDRDNSNLQHIYDEEDPAVIWAILVTIFTGQKYKKKIGFCGQGVSNSVIVRGVVAIAGITVASVVPDTYYQTKLDIAAIEEENLTVKDLGKWLSSQHFKQALSYLKQNAIVHFAKEFTTPKQLQEWYNKEIAKRHEKLATLEDSRTFEKEKYELEEFSRILCKYIIYANWDWNETILSALQHAGFSTIEEQERALLEQRDYLKKKKLL